MAGAQAIRDHLRTIPPDWGHPGGGEGGRDLLLTQKQKEAIFLTQLRRLLLSTGTAIAPASSVSNLACLHSSPAVQACLLPGTGAKLECGIFPTGLRDCLLPRQLWSGREYYQTTDLEKEGQATLSA